MLTWIVLGLVTAQRLAELIVSRHNTARLVARGGVEHGASHYPFIVVLHALWLAGLWILAPGRPVALAWLGVFLALQGLRLWVLASLGPRWTTRIIVLPGEALVRRGPYRFMSHPNYAVVEAEMLVLPLVFGLFWLGVLFALLNAAVLAVRIAAENRALGR